MRLSAATERMTLLTRSLRLAAVRYVLIGAAMPIGYATAALLNARAAFGQAAGQPPTAPAAAAPAMTAAGHTVKAPPAGPLGLARSWGYQLQAPDPARLADAPHDVLVIDYSRNGRSDGILSAADVARMKARPDGSKRIVLAYLSIGEAEDYRFYWKRHYGWLWGLFAPSWRGKHNAEWAGNYGVRYWEQSWADIVYAGPGSYLERIIAAGFDGVYLDKIDEFDDMEKERPTAKADMVAFVSRLATKARETKPGFMIVPQNGDELLADAGYRRVIDAIAKESLLYGEDGEGVENAAPKKADRIARLHMLRAEGKPVFAVEYLDRAAQISSARAELEQLGFVPHFANRALDHMRFGDLPEPGEGARKP
jgi:cysteinyl-tRNA synthetase, unknown class